MIQEIKDERAGLLQQGRVSKATDGGNVSEMSPRADEVETPVLETLGEEDLETTTTNKEVEKIALEDEYFVSRKLYPNVDFYSGIVQRAIGIPVNLFTGVFTLARTVGWIAQLNEMISDPEYKIGRPRQLFTGSVARNVKPVTER